MHQHPRPSPRSATPASNPSTNPERTNNSRDQPPTRTRSSVDLASYTERAGGDAAAAVASRGDAAARDIQDRESTKLNQIIQHFHTKAALMICSARANLPQVQTKNGETRQNRWFNIVLDETDVLAADLQEWKRPDLYETRPPPLVIEVFLDTAQLSHNQALVILDDFGRRWDVSEALAPAAGSSSRPTKNGGRQCEVVLERWTIELGDPAGYAAAELNDLLPNVYKKGVVLFRSLYTLLRLLPAWKLHKQLSRQPGSHQALRLKFRIRQGHSLAHSQKDPLHTPLCPPNNKDAEVVARDSLHPLLTPAGPLTLRYSYRHNCVFGVSDRDSLLSSRFLEADGSGTLGSGTETGHLGGRSLPGQRSERARGRYSSTAAPETNIARDRPRGLLGAYGSLGTFHGSDKRGSPVSELKQLALENDDGDDMDRLDQIRAEEGATRPLSAINFIENPPFKAGSLASSPRPSPSPSTSAGKNESILTKYGSAQSQASKRASLNTLPQQHLRTPSIPSETAVASSSSSSPKPPAPVRYSSSFANRPRRFTSQSSQAERSNTSSGRASSDSKEKPGQLNEGTPGSSGSVKTDEEEIASFISDLEKVKDIKFHTPPSQRDNVVNLAKYSSMMAPSTQLAEEMSSSSLINPSSTPPSRRLSNVPGLSTSSSPNRAISAIVGSHQPHVPSRLSTHSIVEEGIRASGSSGSPNVVEEEEDEPELPFIFPQENFLD